MSGPGLGVFVICPLEGCTGSFVFASGVATFSQNNMSVPSGRRGLRTDTGFSCLGFGTILSEFISDLAL